MATKLLSGMVCFAFFGFWSPNIAPCLVYGGPPVPPKQIGSLFKTPLGLLVNTIEAQFKYELVGS